MAGDVTLEPVPLEQKPVLARLLQMYLYEFTQYEPWTISDTGEYAYRYLDAYWAPWPGEERYPLLIRTEGELAGFAMVRAVNGSNVMAEFFVLRKFRRRGIGSVAAKAVFRRFPGSWIVHEHPKNLPAQEFWPKVIASLTPRDFLQEVSADGAVTQRFAI